MARPVSGIARQIVEWQTLYVTKLYITQRRLSKGARTGGVRSAPVEQAAWAGACYASGSSRTRLGRRSGETGRRAGLKIP
jgi:hypothetical protein